MHISIDLDSNEIKAIYLENESVLKKHNGIRIYLRYVTDYTKKGGKTERNANSATRAY
jgi:hypothetical protein